MSLPLLHAGRTNPGLSAQLDLRFALDKSLTAYRGPTPSFSRASTGSYFDASGVLRYANVNILTYSEDFSDGSWTKANSVSITANDIVAPNGTLTADRMTAASNISSVYKSMTVISGQTYSFSVYAKAGNFSKIVMEHRQNVINPDAVFDLSNGTLVSGTGVITSIGNGWYRCSISEATVDTSDLFIIGFESTATNGSYVYLWGAQLEASSTVGTYCPTTSSANSAPRFDHTYNGTSWVSRGLLVEDQRTNLVQFSEQFDNAYWAKVGISISSNNENFLNESLVADKITINSSNSGHFIYSTPVAATSFVTGSVFLKKGNSRYIHLQMCEDSYGRYSIIFDFDSESSTAQYYYGTQPATSSYSIVKFGSWFRVSLTISKSTTSSSNNSFLFGFSDSASAPSVSSYGAPVFTGNGTDYFWACGVQVEAGSFPTSYIPTTSASSTRSADVCQITGSDFSGFWNGTEGSVAVEFDQLADATKMTNESYIYGFHNAADTEQFILRGQSSGVYYWRSVNSGNIEATAQISSLGTATVKHAACYKLNDFASTFNGAAVVSDTSGATPNPTALGIGFYWPASSNRLNGHIARLRYYNKRLPNATLQLLSDPDPTLNLQFALNKTLTPVAGPAPSFSRASTGTYFNASGVLTSASINTPRFDHVFSGGQWVSRGLLVEEQRTNSLSNSEDFTVWIKGGNGQINSNVATAPDGTTTADEIQVNSGAASAYEIYRLFTYSSVPYSISIFVKYVNNRWVTFGTNAPYHNKCVFFDILNGVVGTASPNHSGEIINCGNGWFRLIVKFVGNTGTNNVIDFTLADGDGVNSCTTGAKVLVWGAQIEAGSFSTSYIGTTSSSVTRSADVCQITGTSFNWMWNQGEGSVVAEYDRLFSASSISNASTVFQAFIDGSNNDRYALFHNSSGTVGERFNVTVGNVEYANLDSGVSVSQPIGRASSAYKLNDFALTVNGGSIVSDTSGLVVSNADKLNIGRMYSSNWLNGHIASIRYYPARLTNTKLQQLST